VTTLEDRSQIAGGDAPREDAIVVEDVSKKFRLYRERASSLKETITARFGRRARFEDFWALRDVSLRVPKGSTYGLIGHNGSGKSTLLRLMAGIHVPTSGRVTAHGRVSALLELGAGFHPELSGRENIYLNGSILGLRRREINAVLDDIIEFAGLENFIDSTVKHYSSGMYVRLGFAIAVHVRPDILMIDEVIAVGDEEFQRRCFDHLYKLRREGVTIVLVSHSAPLMEQLCDEIAWLDHGRLQQIGPPAEVVRAYLDVVNEAQNERLAAVAADDADAVKGPERARRQGTREIEIVGFELLDKNGDPMTSARTGDPLTIRIRYHAKEPIDEPVFGLGFTTERGVRTAGPNTRFAGVDTGRVEGDGYVDYTTERLPLMPGVWRLSVAVVDQSMLHTYDHLEEVYQFHVQTGSSPERYGIVDLNGQWRV
jgi:ABC-2 type transport system ATP-binding protein/lipopolysaccharide transport system ATP-binding protein